MDISVIMPAYNSSAFIAEAINSVLNQSFNGSFELLIVDDHSIDNTYDIINSFYLKYPGIISIFKNDSNKGCSDSSLFLCSKAKGKYLAFCDSDDIWIDRDKLQNQYDFLEGHQEYGMICSNAITEKYIHENVADIQLFARGRGHSVGFKDLIFKDSDVYNSSIFLRKSLYSRMSIECEWYIKNKYFFDTVWAYWFSLNSKIWEDSIATCFYRVSDNSDCHATDIERSNNIAKRYFLIKTRFLLDYDIDIDLKLDILSKEYDYLHRNSVFEGETRIRRSKSYKIGKRITSFFKCFKQGPK